MVCKKSLICMVLTLMCAISAVGCAQSTPLITEEEAAKLPLHQSAWLAYWDTENGLKEQKKTGKELESLVYFAANFTPEGNLTYPGDLENARKKAKKTKAVDYISVVNDITAKGDVVALKDTKILGKVLADEAARGKHIDELLALTQKEKMPGLEIDYENVWKDDTTTKLFPLFIEELNVRAKANNLKLRVVLEPSTPFSKIQWPVGPEYVVMLYNLYGPHSGPGPKAARQFIYNTMGKMANLPEPKVAAFSKGGCIWSSKGKPKFISENEAQDLLKKHKAKATRDINSKALSFKFREGTNVQEVWFADKETLKAWALWSRQFKVDKVAWWRLGS